ncbi:MAG TPA: hypothetical protein VFO16_09725, partial [Pseudonocardiaceae bacterium]|nr:hypothetical protein [Pseudonocardiaceae bacterium]
EVLSWLTGDHPASTPAWLAVLHHTATGTTTMAQPSAEVIDKAIQQNSSTALQALDIASRRAAWDRLSEPLWQQLIATALRPPADPSRQILMRDLTTLAPIEADPRARAYLDVVLESCGLPAANPPLSMVQLDGYVEELARAIACVSLSQRTAVTGGLIRHVLEVLTGEASRTGWDPAAKFLLTALDRLPVAGPGDLAEMAGEILERPGCGGLLRPLASHGGERWERLVAASDRLRLAVPRLLFEEAALGDASAEELARCWAPVILAEQSRDVPARKPSLEALAGWSSRTRDDELFELIQRTLAQLVKLGMPRRPALLWREDMIVQVARDQALGAPAAEALISSLRQAMDRVIEANARRLSEIERDEAEQRRQREIIDDELARLAAEKAEITDEQRRQEEFLNGLSAKPKRGWVPAVVSAIRRPPGAG